MLHFRARARALDSFYLMNQQAHSRLYSWRLSLDVPFLPPQALLNRNRCRWRWWHPAQRMWKETITKCKEQETAMKSARGHLHTFPIASASEETIVVLVQLLLQLIILCFEQMYYRRRLSTWVQQEAGKAEENPPRLLRAPGASECSAPLETRPEVLRN